MNPPRADALDAASIETALVVRARQGDLEAFDALVAMHQDRIFNLCVWLVGDRDDAADAAQDAFIRAYRFLPKFRGDAAFGTWLGRIAVNVARDAAARRKRAPKSLTKTNAEEEEDDSQELASDAPSPSEVLLRRERQSAVRIALAGLHENHRVVLVLFELQGFAYEEVSHILQLPVGTIKSRIHRARTALREALDNQRELFDA